MKNIKRIYCDAFANEVDKESATHVLIRVYDENGELCEEQFLTIEQMAEFLKTGLTNETVEKTNTQNVVLPKTNKKKYCRECGMELSIESKFCSNCGAAINSVNSSPGNKNISWSFGDLGRVISILSIIIAWIATFYTAAVNMWTYEQLNFWKMAAYGFENTGSYSGYITLIGCIIFISAIIANIYKSKNAKAIMSLIFLVFLGSIMCLAKTSEYSYSRYVSIKPAFYIVIICVIFSFFAESIVNALNEKGK